MVPTFLVAKNKVGMDMSCFCRPTGPAAAGVLHRGGGGTRGRRAGAAIASVPLATSPMRPSPLPHPTHPTPPTLPPRSWAAMCLVWCWRRQRAPRCGSLCQAPAAPQLPCLHLTTHERVDSLRWLRTHRRCPTHSPSPHRPPRPQFKPGDRVFGCTGQQIFNDPYGTYAELVSAKESTLAHVPEGVGLDAAAGVPLAAMTAWQALAPSMPLAGKRVLVHGGSGGVGGFGIPVCGGVC